MSDGLIEDAISCLRGEGWDNEADAVTELVAELKRLREASRESRMMQENEIKRLQECCEKYSKRVMRQEASMLKVISRNREQRKQLATKDAEICVLKTEVCAAKKNLVRRDVDIENLMKELAVKDSHNNDPMANCNQLRNRCWKAEGELAKWREIAIEAKAEAIYSMEWRDTIREYPTESHHMSMYRDYEDKSEYREQAVHELGIQISQEDSSEDLTIAYMLGGKKADERLKVLLSYVERLEKEFIASETAFWQAMGEVKEASSKAQAALAKIRAREK
jgi:hypothetical protein